MRRGEVSNSGTGMSNDLCLPLHLLLDFTYFFNSGSMCSAK
jgi:hypothetical protein